MFFPLFQRNLINNFAGKSPDQNGSEHTSRRSVCGRRGQHHSQLSLRVLPAWASPRFQSALQTSLARCSPGGGRSQWTPRKWSQSKCPHATLSPRTGLAGTLKSGSGRCVLWQCLGAPAAAAVTRGRAREGSLRSSTWPQGPCRCSRAAHSGKRSCTWPSTTRSGLPPP